MMGRDADLLVVVARVPSGIHDRETVLSGEAGAKVGARHRMGVIPARPAGLAVKR